MPQKYIIVYTKIKMPHIQLCCSHTALISEVLAVKGHSINTATYCFVSFLRIVLPFHRTEGVLPK